MTPQIRNLQVIGRELAIAWSDGHETYLPLETLRRACPCAVCNGEPDVLGRGERPQVTHSPDSFELLSYDLVGGYGWQPKWADGHATGIYSVGYLRHIDTQSPRA
ncbi:MAG: DUF971 domain-containing protein [Chthoniobacterales bacterium]|nr:DUF971 domain-containing protein [Chthoniobacterales bacterium]